MARTKAGARIVSYVRHHHLGLLALFVALGGTAVAAGHHDTAPKNSVVSKSIRKGAVTGPKLAKNAVDGAKVRDRSITGQDIDLDSLGAVPQAANAGSLGGFPAGAYVRSATPIPPGSDLAGTYDQPLVRVGRETVVPGPVTMPKGFPTPEFSVSIEAPASGLIEVMAWATLSASPSSTTFTLLRNDGALVGQVLTVSGATKTVYTSQGSGSGTEDPQAAQWIPIFTTPGWHTISLAFTHGGAETGAAEGIHLLARAFS